MQKRLPSSDSEIHPDNSLNDTEMSDNVLSISSSDVTNLVNNSSFIVRFPPFCKNHLRGAERAHFINSIFLSINIVFLYPPVTE